MYVFWIIEWGVRLFYYPYFGRGGDVINNFNDSATPGIYLAPYLLVFLIIFFILSLRESK